MLKNILVIDSDIENFNEIAANLRDDTTDVQYAATVQIALQKMIAFNYCLIILDVLRRYTGLHPLTQRGYAVVSHEDILIDTARRMVSLAGQEIQLLNAEKIPTPSKFKNKQGFYHLWWNGIGGNKLWDSNVVLAILRDERYLGSVVYGKRFRPEVGNYRTVKNGKSDWIVVHDRHEPVVTVEEFKAAQANLREYVEQDSFGKTIHLFTGKIRCGICGYALARNHSADPRFDCTTEYRIDDCDCMKGSIKESEIAEVVLTAIHAYIKVLLDEQTLIKQAKKDNRISTEKYTSVTMLTREMLMELVSRVWVWADNRFEIVLNFRDEFEVILDNIEGEKKLC